MRYNAAILDDRRRRRAGFLSGQTGLSKKRPLFQNGDNGLLALLRHHGQLDLARVDIEHRLGYLPLENSVCLFKSWRLDLPLPTWVRNSWGLKSGVREGAIGQLLIGMFRSQNITRSASALAVSRSE